jgi:hypothetical protein
MCQNKCNCKEDNEVIIEVLGGVAEVVKHPPNIKVIIKDHDNDYEDVKIPYPNDTKPHVVSKKDQDTFKDVVFHADGGNNVCQSCVWYCIAKGDSARWCMANQNYVLYKLFNNYDPQKNGCSKFKEGVHSFYG